MDGLQDWGLRRFWGEVGWLRLFSVIDVWRAGPGRAGMGALGFQYTRLAKIWVLAGFHAAAVGMEALRAAAQNIHHALRQKSPEAPIGPDIKRAAACRFLGAQRSSLLRQVPPSLASTGMRQDAARLVAGPLLANETQRRPKAQCKEQKSGEQNREKSAKRAKDSKKQKESKT